MSNEAPSRKFKIRFDICHWDFGVSLNFGFWTLSFVYMKNYGSQILFSYLLVILGASARLLPHAPNFTPIAALALFGAVYLKKRDSLWVPLAAMVLSDILIGFYHSFIMASVYGSFVLVGVLGIWLRSRRGSANNARGWWGGLFGCSLLGSTIFFLITNWAVWAWGGLYPHSFQGLLLCYGMALPFFRNTLFGDLFYVSLFFGIAELMPGLVRLLRSKHVYAGEQR